MILCPFLEIKSFSNLAGPMSELRVVSVQSFHMVFCGSPLIRGNKRNTDQWASMRHRMEGLFRHNSSVAHRSQKSREFENDCISRRVHRFNITQPNLMILVSFTSAEDGLSNYVIFNSQCTENPPFRFFGPRGIITFMSKWNEALHC